MFNRQRFRRHLDGSSKGFTLVEVIIAIAIVGIVGISVLMALGITGHALFIADEQATAVSVAVSVIEFVKGAGFAASYTLPSDFNTHGFTVTISAKPLHEDIQRITVVVSRDAREIVRMEGFKVNR